MTESARPGPAASRDQETTPTVHPDAWVHPAAILEGDVRIAAGARVLAGAVLTAAGSPIEIGEFTIVMEHAVLRSSRRDPLIVGDHGVVGAHANLAGCRVGPEVFLATGAAIFPGAVIGAGAEVRIHGVVQVDSVLEPGAMVPIGWVAVGHPARILPPGEHDAIWAVQRELDFPRRVFGADRTGPHPMREITERWARALGDPAGGDPR